MHCTACAYAADVADYRGIAIPPDCPRCGALVRPRIVLFGEALPGEALERLHETLRGGVDLVLSIGTSSGFPYIAQPILLAARVGLPTAEINPGASEVSHLVRWRIRAGAASTLRALLDLLEKPRSA